MKRMRKIRDNVLYKKFCDWAYEKDHLDLKEVRKAVEESKMKPEAKKRLLKVSLNPDYYLSMKIRNIRGEGGLQEFVRGMLDKFDVLPERPKKIKPPKIKVPRKNAKVEFISRLFTKEELKKLR